MKELIVTADDFGMAHEVNDAVQRGHLCGILTAASLMVSGAAAADAVSRARAMPSLRVGLHIVLVEGRPASPPSKIPDLVGSNGYFRRDMVWVAVEMFTRPKVRKQLDEEIAAQFDAFRATGLALDHVNAHKHFHLHPTITNSILKVGKAYGMRAMRLPLEPRVLPKIAGTSARIGRDHISQLAARVLRWRLRATGICTPDMLFGLKWSGAINKARLLGLITHLGDGLAEIYLHPATLDSFDGAVPGYSYEEELEAVMDAEVADAVREQHITTGGFSDFCKMS